MRERVLALRRATALEMLAPQRAASLQHAPVQGGPSGERRESVGELPLAGPQRVSLLRIAVEKLAAVRFGAEPERFGVRPRARRRLLTLGSKVCRKRL